MDTPQPPGQEDPGAGAGGQPLPLPRPPEPAAYPPTNQGPAAPPPGLSDVAALARRRAGIAVTLGGVLVVIGVFLPWVTATGPGGSVSVNGIKVGTFGTLILGGFAIARGMSMIRPSAFGMNLGTPLIGGALLAGLMVLRWGDIQNAINEAEAVSPLIHASIGIGVWSVIAGTALILAGGLLAQLRR